MNCLSKEDFSHEPNLLNCSRKLNKISPDLTHHIIPFIPHSIYYNLQEGMKILTISATSETFLEKPFKNTKFLLQTFITTPRNLDKLPLLKQFWSPMMLLHTQPRISSLSQYHQIPKKFQEKIFKKISYSRIFLDPFSLKIFSHGLALFFSYEKMLFISLVTSFNS